MPDMLKKNRCGETKKQSTEKYVYDDKCQGPFCRLKFKKS